METEVKLLLPPGTRAAVEAHPSVAGIVPVLSRDLSTYYDTPDFALRRRGVSLRIRSSEDRLVQTVKWRDPAAGFGSRGEAEWPIASDGLDSDAIAGEPAARDALGDDLARVAPIFTTEVARAKRLVHVEGGTTVEVSIDEGEVRAGDRRAPLDEVEFELKGGVAGPVYRLAADLARRHGLRFGPESKAERGYALLIDDLPPNPGAAALVFDKDVTLAAAVPLMVAAGCRDFAADLSGAARGAVEGIHRSRTAIRKLRTLFALFAPHLDPAAAARFDADLRDLGRVLGRGRDRDVFLTDTLADAEHDLGAAMLAPLRARATASDREAHAAVTDTLRGPLPTDLLLGLALWTTGRHWLDDPDAPEADAPLRHVLPDLLDRLERKVLRRSRHMRSADDEALHGLRKALKTLRYASDDVASLFKPKTVDPYLGRIKKVLGSLGRINDAAVTIARVAGLSEPGHPDLAAAAEELLAWNRARRTAAERDLQRHWRRFRRAEPFWG